MKINRSAFTLIAIIGLLVTLSVLALSNARVASRVASRDAKRVSDVKQMQSALELFFDANNRYPTNAEFQSGSLKSFASTTGTTTYMSVIPVAPTPVDGNCSNSDNSYAYNAPADGSTYTLNFCVAKKINDLSAGNLTASPGGITRGFLCGDSIAITALAGHACNTGAPDYDTCAYGTVSIGAQCWLKQNLNIGTMVTGTTTQSNIPPVLEKYCYGNITSNCQTQGGLYQWDEAMQYGALLPGAQGICPSGWHIPTHDQWTVLERAVCTSGTCATDFPYDLTPTSWRGTNEGSKLSLFVAGGNNSSGFTGLLVGGRGKDGSFNSQGASAGFWSSSVSGASAWSRALNSGHATVNRYANSRAYGYSVRCLRD